MLYDLERTDVRLRILANIKKHYETPQIVNILSHGNNPGNIASQLSFLYQLSFCHGTRAVISPPTLTRFWYGQAYHVFNGFKGAVRLKALFFVDFDPFSSISSQDSIQSKNDSIKLQSLIQ